MQKFIRLFIPHFSLNLISLNVCIHQSVVWLAGLEWYIFQLLQNAFKQLYHFVGLILWLDSPLDGRFSPQNALAARLPSGSSQIW